MPTLRTGLIIAAVASLALWGCAGAYVAGDAGPHHPSLASAAGR